MTTEKGYLAVYDYGQGGIWLVLEAPSWAEAQAAFPKLKVFEARPGWMSEADEATYRERCESMGFRWNVHSPPTGWLKMLVEQG
jgi:hypothetical protein